MFKYYEKEIRNAPRIAVELDSSRLLSLIWEMREVIFRNDEPYQSA